MSLILRELRRSLTDAGFNCAWEWPKLEASDSRGAKLNGRDMGRVEQAPPGNHNVAAGYEVDSEKPNHDGEYSHIVSVGQE